MSNIKDKISIGDLITVKYFSVYKKTQVSFVKVTNIGRKYLYGKTMWIAPGEELREGHPIDYIIDKITIYEGIRRDLKELIEKYETNLRAWQRNKDEKDKEIDWELRNLKDEKMDAWKKKNPMPQPPILPEPE